jgi:hypothetical protein
VREQILLEDKSMTTTLTGTSQYKIEKEWEVGDLVTFNTHSCISTRETYCGKVEHKEQWGAIVMICGKQYNLSQIINVAVVSAIPDYVTVCGVSRC